MKKYLLFSFLLLTVLFSQSKPVPVATAKLVAKNFFQTTASGASGIPSFALAYTRYLAAPANTLDSAGHVLYYIFNAVNGDGFVIVSGDDVVTPILGYSPGHRFEETNIPPAFEKWMENDAEQIAAAILNQFEPGQEITARWNDLLSGKYQPGSRNAVNPLLTTTWNQSPYYNALCPGGSVTGCVATAMAQIMKYWNYPTTGSGFHSYNHQVYGTLSANFGSTTYNWGAMPNNVTSSNTAVATLMFQCGVSVDMNYSPTESGAWVIAADNPVCAENSYKTYFGYNPATIQGLRRSNYTDVAWKNLLKNDLNNNRPIQYAGFGTGGGHTFVCDGYDANDFFHMNWGWAGQDNGFFDLDALNPGTVGTGGGAGGYNSGQEAVIGIAPVSGGGNPNADIQLYSTITVNPNPIGFGQAFTVNADVINNGATSFSGTFCAALFTTGGTFIAYIDSLTTGGNPLPPTYHYTGGLTFSNGGLLTVPGTYQIGIFYRPAGGNWFLAGNTTYTNPVNITITGPSNPLNLYSAITPSPSTFVTGQAASVNVNFINNNATTYYGTYEADLYDLNGNYVETIGSYTESAGLPSGYDYLNPYITFSTSAVTAPPGTYILAISEYENNTWYLAGSTYDPNPVNIQVVAPGLSPDVYETNNSQATAHLMPLTWSGNAAHVVTTGSNIHVDTDIDFYKINLPAGYNYTITARANDSYSSGDGFTYTNDVLWSYNTGSGWSSTFDDVMPGNIQINGSGTVTFQVASYFPGNTGTYVMDIHITRSAVAGLNTPEAGVTPSLFPNPSGQYTWLKNPCDAALEDLQLFDALGQLQATYPSVPAGSSGALSVADLPNGLYELRAVCAGKMYVQKIMVVH